VFGADDVEPLIERYFPAHAGLYERIVIPAARSDVARLLLLFEQGGLYTDCHMGIVDAQRMRDLLTSLDTTEAIFVERTASLGAVLPGGRSLINGAMFSRPRNDLMHEICTRALKNLAWQEGQEHRHGWVPYSIWFHTGPWLTTSLLLEAASVFREVRPEYIDRVQIVSEDDVGLVRARHPTYAVPDQHWSARQELEPLFTPRSSQIS
jgi:mannosyltransferase OCH1-like enzyme